VGKGRAKVTDSDLLLAIQELLSGTVWTSDTLDEIAELMRESGYEIKEVKE